MVAKGVFAPGHLGELTRIVPFDMIDAVLAETGQAQRRLRLLPSRVVVYLLLAAGLFPEVGYLGVWDKLVAGLGGLGLTRPSGTGLWHARVRVGAAPLKALFDLLRGPASSARTCGARWNGLIVAAIDGTVFDVPDSTGNTLRLGKIRNQNGDAGYPQVRLVALVACGTRAVIDVVFGSRRLSVESGQAQPGACSGLRVAGATVTRGRSRSPRRCSAKRRTLRRL